MEYGIFSLLPSLMAIVLAITTRQVIVSLLSGIFIGKLALNGWNFFAALDATLKTIVGVFTNEWMTKTILFSLLVGAILVLIQLSGGVEGFVYFLTEKKKNRSVFIPMT